jgi:hypothetical protein
MVKIMNDEVYDRNRSDSGSVSTLTAQFWAIDRKNGNPDTGNAAGVSVFDGSTHSLEYQLYIYTVYIYYAIPCIQELINQLDLLRG